MHLRVELRVYIPMFTAIVIECSRSQRCKTRMPVFLAHECVGKWIDPHFTGDHALVQAVSAAAALLADDLFAYPVAPLSGDGPNLIRAISR